MTPLDKAKVLLSGETVFAAVSGDNVITSARKGISALLEYATGGLLNGASVADKIVGKAAALLMAFGKVKEVYAALITPDAQSVFLSRGIAFSYGAVTDKIINREGTDSCPMEKTVANISDPSAAVAEILETLKKLQKK